MHSVLKNGRRSGSRARVVLVAISVAAALSLVSARQPAQNPEDHLPPNISRLTWFGERASWSPDGGRIAFMSKSFGDAFEVEVATRRIRLLTPWVHAGYLRVQYLPTGDYFLIGARTFTDIRSTREHDEEMWILPRSGTASLPIGHRISEGVAISRRTPLIAWANTHGQYPDQLGPGESAIYTATVVVEGDHASLHDVREVLRAHAPECTLEAQDFRNDDTELIYTCYRDRFADVFGVDLRNQHVTRYRRLEGEYNEVEGIFPDGRHALVESSRGQTSHDSSHIDLWRLRLEPDSSDFVRLTHWGDSPGYKASNPVVSPDGSSMAFQSARSNEPAGVGHGIFLMTGIRP
jgi:WD40-like Beta Propeller Repeat